MPTQYLTLILRIRLESQDYQNPKFRLVGSLQQVGSEQIHYFDSPKKLREALAKSLHLQPEDTTSCANP